MTYKDPEKKKNTDRKYRLNHKGEKREYDKQRYETHKEEKKITHKNYYQNHKEERKEYGRNYYQRHKEERKVYIRSEAGKIAQKKSQKLHNQKYPEKVNAINYAKYHNLRGTECYVCNSTEYLEGHHPDYSRPEWVKTLCREHHDDVKVNRKLLQEAIQQSISLATFKKVAEI